MGYTTDFNGSFELNKPLTVTHMNTLKAFANKPHSGSEDETFPSIWCQWVPSSDGKSIEWDGNEKFYEYTDWLAHLIEKFLEPWGYVLNGEVTWQGESPDDIGMLVVENNVVSERAGTVVYKEDEPEDDAEAEGLAKLLTDLPRTIVGDGKSPNIFFVTNTESGNTIAVLIGDDMEEAAIALADSCSEPLMVEDRLTGVVHDNPAGERLQDRLRREEEG